MKKKKQLHTLTLGVEVKRCEKCDRGDCATCCYKSEFERLMGLPNCNDCAFDADQYCAFRPRIGETVRINCPLWTSKKAEK